MMMIKMANRTEELMDGDNKREEFKEEKKNLGFKKRVLLGLVCILMLLVTSLLVALMFSIYGKVNECQNVKNNDSLLLKAWTSNPVDDNVVPDDRETESPWNHLRLPRSVLPVKYRLELTLEPDDLTFTGSVDIKLKINQTTNMIVIHSAELLFNKTDTKIIDSNGNVMITNNTFVDKLYETFIITLKDKLIEGKEYNLLFKKFQGFIRNDMRALYRSNYKTSSGTIRNLIASQLQAIDARRVFPCFDEPDMKAVYSVSIIHSKDYVALSNTEVNETLDLGGGKVIDRFEDTPLMSTYLLAFVVSDFVYTNVTMETGLKIRVWSRPDMINLTAYAMDLIPTLYNFYTDYFQLPEHVKKVDHVAIPEFSSSAMENWGLIIYRENVLLYDHLTTSDHESWMISLTIAHEIAHSWFGNMVTMHWWTDLWLNEGFASILMYLPFVSNHNSSDALDAQLKSKFAVMTSDSFSTSHPVTMPINNLHDINNGFDKISYDKGLSLLRMLMGFLGYENFRDGLRAYVKKYKFSNADAFQLWTEMEGLRQLPFRVDAIMNTWMQQKGFPVVHVKQSSAAGNYALRQTRFLTNSADGSEVKDQRSNWIISFNYVTEDDLKPKVIWMDEHDAEITVSESSWLLGNVDSMGYYLVDYEPLLWDRLIHQMMTNYSVFSVASRADLINNAFSLARSDRISYDVAFNLSIYIKRETHLVPVIVMVGHAKFLQVTLSSSSTHELLKKFIGSLLQPSITRIINNPPEEKLQTSLMELLCVEGVRYDIKEILELVQKYFQKWKNNRDVIHPTYALASFISAVKYGGEEDWDYLWNELQETSVVSTSEMLLCALGHSRQAWILRRYLSNSMNSSLIRPQYIQSVYTCMCETQLGRHVAFDFVINNWKEIIAKFESDIFTMKDIGSTVFKNIDTEHHYHQLLETLKITPPPESVKKEFENILHQINSNLQWKKSNKQEIKKWLKENVK